MLSFVFPHSPTCILDMNNFYWPTFMDTDWFFCWIYFTNKPEFLISDIMIFYKKNLTFLYGFHVIALNTKPWMLSYFSIIFVLN